MPSSFVAYPSKPSQIGATIRSALEIIGREHPDHNFVGWEESDVAGRFIIDPILNEIEDADLLSADITRLNFNVTFEIGYAIAKSRRTLLLCNGSLVSDDVLIREAGIYDTLGYRTYSTSRELATFLTRVSDIAPLSLRSIGPAHQPPVYLLLPKTQTDLEIQLISRIKKARLPFRSFDPIEHGRLPAGDAISNVAASHGVIVPLLSMERKDAQVHNLRAAFVAGLAAGMEKHLLLIQFGDDPVPIDYRDLVSRATTESQIEELIAAFAPLVVSSIYADATPVARGEETLLQQRSFGASSAENEMEQLPAYYLETEEYRKVSRGEAHVVTGRKGSGKTALFVRLRNDLRRKRNQTVILDLRPEGFQLLKFKDVVLRYLEQGTKEHTVTAFWEYLLLLEVCHKIIEVDKDTHVRNHNLYSAYQDLVAEYGGDDFVAEGDFAERMLKLMDHVAREFATAMASGTLAATLSSGTLTQLLYQHDTAALRTKISAYLKNKSSLWILFDNIDKGWPATGLGADDALIIRCLLDAIWKLSKYFKKQEFDCHGVVFLRNDVYELLLHHTADRGKIGRVLLDWTDAELLRELVRLRIVAAAEGFEPDTSFEDAWQEICVSHIGSEESSGYMIDRCLMRPRSLIDFLQYCRSHALNLGHKRIEKSDIEKGEDVYSSELLENIGFEIRDIMPIAGDVLYEFVAANKNMSRAQVTAILQRAGLPDGVWDELIELLLWYGVLGVLRENGDVSLHLQCHVRHEAA